ncbi:MAG TPA: ADP-ribosylglycohydrolase family protein [Candidatus Rifleibacterium sp.]|nr:ADP-ribosylglycohydrolase family protein [Candidatus Rifleibacterium sp.]
MLGAIAGDIIGSVYEHKNTKSKDFELFTAGSCFTDDSVLTLAIADCLLTGADCRANLLKFYHAYPDAGFGGGFHAWANSEDPQPYNSWGNGAAMRISPAGFAFSDLDTVLAKAKEFTMVTHNHPEGIKGAQATAAAVFLARTGSSKDEIRNYIERTFAYDLSRHIDEIRPGYRFDVSCQGSVPQAIRAFIDSTGYEDAIRCAISLGGDSDTIACITGGIAQAFYGPIPEFIARQVYEILDSNLKTIATTFMQKYCP